jgi:peroxiredoxin
VISALAVLPLVALALAVAPAQQESRGGKKMVTTGGVTSTEEHNAAVYPTLAIGSQAPDFNLPGVDGKTYSLKDFDYAKLLAVVFNCDHCPVASMYEDRIKKLTEDYRDRGVAVVMIMPNANSSATAGASYSEESHTDMGDTFDEMRMRAAFRRFDFPYLNDGANQEVARQYGPATTPHIFIFDQERKLRYQGDIDDSMRESLVKRRDARNAFDALLAGQQVPLTTTPAFGCSIKWASRAGGPAEARKREAAPVRLEAAGPDQLKELSKNGTGKFLLVNFWATSSGVSVKEFPDVQRAFLMYRGRPFTVVTVNTDTPDRQKDVQAFLEEQHASTRNLVLGSTETKAAIGAFGMGWNGSVPYMVLMDPVGNVLYRKHGWVDTYEVRHQILAALPDDRYFGIHDFWVLGYRTVIE